MKKSFVGQLDILADAGIGMPQEVVSRIFDALTRMQVSVPGLSYGMDGSNVRVILTVSCAQELRDRIAPKVRTIIGIIEVMPRTAT